MPAPLTIEQLNAVQLFHGERPETYSWVLDVMTEHTLAAGEVLLHPEQPNTRIYFVLEGELRVELQVDGRPEITRLGVGACAGELSVLDRKLTSAYVVADRPTRLVSLERDYIWQLINTSHAVARNLLFTLSSKVRQDNRALGESLALQHYYEQYARIDALTGLHNRFWLEQMLPRFVERARTSGDSLGIILLDVDEFKRYNDRHGHLAGDQALRSLGATLLRNIRPNDAAARVGGEEFLVVLPNTSEEDCGKAAWRICDAIRYQSIHDHEAHRLPGITVSVGVAMLTRDDDHNRLYDAADQALYSAKRAGRDRVIIAARP